MRWRRCRRRSPSNSSAEEVLPRRHLARASGALAPAGITVDGEGRRLRATEQPIDTGTATGKCFLDMLGVYAEFETNLRRERQFEGIAKAAGVYTGRG